MKKITTKKEISEFSSHLFWDVDINKVDINRNKRWLISRVLEYGLIEDWKLLVKYYGIEEIGKVAKSIRDLSNKTVAFISLLTDIPKNEFLCYTTKQLNQKHWNF
ncbi:MAG: hypothetical protein DRJ01_16860 [Bacteroidetes bacterium]|nr:MAG: hypothetical protein DRJ01_16860 [Bacteroidota bacterium]